LGDKRLTAAERKRPQRNSLPHVKFFLQKPPPQKGYPFLGQNRFWTGFWERGREQFSEFKSPPYRGSHLPHAHQASDEAYADYQARTERQITVDRQSDVSRSLHVDDQLELGRPFDRQVRRLRPLRARRERPRSRAAEQRDERAAMAGRPFWPLWGQERT
jgi:hypothetical protein